MFKIYDRRNEFYQWDLNQKLIVEDNTITQVHFCNKVDDCSLVCEVYDYEGYKVVDVPNILLQYPKRISVYAYCANYTKVEETFRVYERTKPADYVYTETEVKNFAALEARMANIENNGVPQEVLNKSISDYFVSNPIETGATAEQAAQITENTKDIAAMEKAAANYALKSELPSIKGLATEDYVDTAIDNIDLPSGNEEFKELFRVATTEEVVHIETGIDLKNYNELYAFCNTLSSNSEITTHFTWGVTRAGFHYTSGLHNTQKRVHYLHAKRINDYQWQLEMGYTTTGNFSILDCSQIKTDSNDSIGTAEYPKNGLVMGGESNNFYFGAYTFGGTSLAIGTEAIVYGR